jgi:hypothetical protein
MRHTTYLAVLSIGSPSFMLEQTLQQILTSLLQPPPTTVVLVYKMLEMLSSNEIGLACYNHLPTSPASLRTCACVSRPRSRCKGQPYNSVRLHLFPATTYLVLHLQYSTLRPHSLLALPRCLPHSLIQLCTFLTSPTFTPATDVDRFRATETSLFFACRTPGVADLPRVSVAADVGVVVVVAAV